MPCEECERRELRGSAIRIRVFVAAVAVASDAGEASERRSLPGDEHRVEIDLRPDRVGGHCHVRHWGVLVPNRLPNETSGTRTVCGERRDLVRIGAREGIRA